MSDLFCVIVSIKRIVTLKVTKQAICSFELWSIMKKVRITVLRKEFYKDFAEKYLTEGVQAGSCALLNEGDTFLFEGNAQMPEGFCPWAWIDIYQSVNAIASGSTFTPWNRRDGQTIVCCTDGIRPVVFRVEAVEDTVD